ncbi:hypothetical protein TSA1_20365 [Bradyrhizobium nitroreducens]|uniref:Uncharacterized protein n=2 Tax=Bradyrhizobium nitroreducens TaxID=709803 RepID=A0A2M6UE06_9BRAD|nr:hypothetical protein TSA1_20365 [Bradyrhizobium nitroreducens]
MTARTESNLLGVIVLCLGLCMVREVSAQNSAPSTEQFMNALGTCAVGMNVKLEGNLLGSIKSFYEGTRTQGRMSLQNAPEFLNLFPENERSKAYTLYVSCVMKILGHSQSLPGNICTQEVINKCAEDARSDPLSAISSCNRVTECDPDNHLAYSRLGQAYRALRRLQEAETSMQKQLSIGQRIPDQGIISSAYYNLGTLYFSKDAYEMAEVYAKKSLEHNEKSSNRPGMGANYKLLGDIYIKRGSAGTAELYYTKSIEAFRGSTDKRGLGGAYGGYSYARYVQGDRSSACTYLSKALSLYQEIDFVKGVGDTQQNMIKARCNSL